MNTSRTESRRTQQHFGRQAELYARSDAHRTGDSLDLITEYASLSRYDTAVDLATGAGFTAFAVAPYARRVLATDIALPMLAQARRLAAERGLANVGFIAVDAENMPFARDSIDLVTCRQAAHHFQDVARFVVEARRTLKPGGVLLLTDPIAPEGEYEAAWMNDVEVRRDSTHRCDLRASQWRSLIEGAGLRITHASLAKVHLEFNDWVQRAATPHGEVEPLRRDFLAVAPSVAAAFGIQPRGDAIYFHWDDLVMRCVKPEADS